MIYHNNQASPEMTKICECCYALNHKNAVVCIRCKHEFGKPISFAVIRQPWAPVTDQIPDWITSATDA
jgi:hypothetical protein